MVILVFVPLSEYVFLNEYFKKINKKISVFVPLSEYVFLNKTRDILKLDSSDVFVPLSEYVFLNLEQEIKRGLMLEVFVPLSEYVFLNSVPCSPHKIKSKKTLCVPKLISSKIY